MIAEKPRILIIDDDESHRNAVEFLLRKENHDVDTASSGREGQRKLTIMELPTVLIVDLAMLDLTGVEILKQAKNHPRLRRIVITAFDEELHAREAKELQVFAYLSKPFTKHSLLFTVESAIKDLEVERLQRDLEIAERNATLSRLVRGVAHTINNTSGLIPANVQAIREVLQSPTAGLAEVDKQLTLIEDVSIQAVEFVKGLLGFSSTRTGSKKKIDVNILISQAIEQMMPDLMRITGGNHVTKDLSLWDEQLICELYELPFIQIVRNLIKNAYQAMEEGGGKITVTSLPESGDTVHISVKDTGCGIERENIDRIFNYDFTTKPLGNGLGLWLVRMNLEEIGATIDVESAVNQGTEFVIKIPRAN